MPLQSGCKEGIMGEEVRITILSENTSGRQDLSAEYGLSVWIEADGAGILFDTGSAGAFESNAARLGVDLSEAAHLVLSHGHFDHTGGIPLALKHSPRMLIHLHPDSIRPKYLSDGRGKTVYIGMAEQSRQVLEEKSSQCLFHTDVSRLSEHVFITGAVPRRTPFEKIVESFCLDAEGRVPDTMEDDQALWVETSEGLVVVLGCAHAGAVNTVEYIREKSGRSDVRAVIGGMHLMNSDSRTIAKTADAVGSWNPNLISPNHCTGEAACAFFQERFPAVYHHGRPGTAFVFSA